MSQSPSPEFKASAQLLPSQESDSRPSLGFNALYHHLDFEHRYRILDLGPAIGNNVDFFSQFRCKLHIEDLYSSLTSFDMMAKEDGFSFDTLFQYLLPFAPQTRFDVILSWDIFNYLAPDELKCLLQRLEAHSVRGTLLLSFIATQKTIPDRPTRFRIVDQESLNYQPGSSIPRAAPRYQQTDLTKMLPRFRVCNSFLLRNGFKEYLLVRS